MGYSVKSYGLKWDLLYYCILECSSVQQGWSDTLESPSESGFLIRNKKRLPGLSLYFVIPSTTGHDACWYVHRSVNRRPSKKGRLTPHSPLEMGHLATHCLNHYITQLM